jgi:hypothetical protein
MSNQDHTISLKAAVRSCIKKIGCLQNISEREIVCHLTVKLTLKLRTSGLKGGGQAQNYASKTIHCVTEE